MNIVETQIVHYPSGTEVSLFSLVKEKIEEKDLERIAFICDQELIYNRLFRERLKDRRYEKKDAVGFVEWATKGWKEKKYFVFLVRNSKGEIGCAVDIKSDYKDMAEVGYWASIDSPGLVTNALIKVCELAKVEGYKRLFALVMTDNTKSADVAKRAGFGEVGSEEKEGKKYKRLEKIL